MVPKEITKEYPCPWRWVVLKRQFNSGDDAKTFLNENFEQISKMIFIQE
jgi:hypothetical protein